MYAVADMKGSATAAKAAMNTGVHGQAAGGRALAAGLLEAVGGVTDPLRKSAGRRAQTVSQLERIR
jgi:hypothetical protein